MGSLRVLAACILMAVFLCGMAYAASVDQVGPASGAIELVEGSAVTLPIMLVERCAGPWLYLKASYPKSAVAIAYASTKPSLTSGSSCRVTGRVLSASGKLFVWATKLQLLVDPKTGRPMPPLPYGWDWPYTRDIPLDLLAYTDGLIPPDEALRDEGTEPLTLTAPDDSISAAKLATGGTTVQIVEKTITEVFRDQTTGVVNFFYVEEPDRSSGIKIVPQGSVTVKETDVVTISGTIIDGAATGECYVSASSVQVVGCRLIKPVGIPQRGLVGGAFGRQPALYRNTDSSPAVAGTGLSSVGLRARVWGKVTERAADYSWFYIDDGSHLVRQGHIGIKVLYYGPSRPTWNVNDYVQGITGALGAELAGTRPVPVLRIHNPRVLYVDADSPGPTFDGWSWNTAYHDIQSAIDAAAQLSPVTDIWVAEGAYNRAYGLHMAVDISMYGGFVAGETDLDQRNWLTHPTVVNTGPIYTPYDVGGPVTIDGFTIYGNGIWVQGAQTPVTVSHNTVTGGAYGIYCQSSDPAIRARVVDNWITNTTYAGIFCYCSSGCPYVIFANNTLVANVRAVQTIRSSPTIVNNIIAFNTTGVYSDGSASCPLFLNNCVYNSPYVSFQYTGSDNITGQDPLLDGVHIDANSPCRNTGLNAYVQPCDTDIVGNPRVAESVVDIGAYESPACWRYTFTLSPESVSAPIGTPVTMNAHVVDATPPSAPAAGIRLNMWVDAGEMLSVTRDGVVTTLPSGTQSTYGITDALGNAEVVVTRASSGCVHLTSVISECHGSGPKQARIWFADPNVPSDVVFVLDRSGSMNGHEASYPSPASVQRLVREISQVRPDTRFGAVVFNRTTPIPQSDCRSISQFVGQNAVDDFCSWVGTFSGTGGTSAQVAALDAAIGDLQAYSPSGNRRLVAYVADVPIGTDNMTARLTLVQQLAALTEGGGGVFVSLWEAWHQSLYHHYSANFTGNLSYPSLAVNGEFDPTNYPNTTPAEDRYLFTNLKGRVLLGQ